MEIRADGATFGRPNGGFTIVGAELPSGRRTECVAIDANDVTVIGNIAMGGQAGFEVGFGERVRIEQNVAVGNGIAGIRFQYAPAGSVVPVAIHGNNTFGNGEAADGCGVLMVVNGSLNATDNYWGKTTGPGPNPGDRAFGSCVTAGTIKTSPFSAVQFPIADPTVQ